MIPRSTLLLYSYPYAPAIASPANTRPPKHPVSVVSWYPCVFLFVRGQPPHIIIPTHEKTNPNYSSATISSDFDQGQSHPPHISRAPSKPARKHTSIQDGSLSIRNSCCYRTQPSAGPTVIDIRLADMTPLTIWARMLVVFRRGKGRFVGGCSLSDSI